MGKFIDLTGQRFGKWTVVKRLENNKNNKAMWLCRCDCGTEKAVLGESLKSRKSQNCGCGRKESVAARNRKNRKYECRGRLYHIWTGIKQRCFNPNEPAYPRYGGRGIVVCDEWKDNFGVFRTWAFASGYNDDLSLDRIDNNGNYEPSNCRWATGVEQNNNRRNNYLITYNGETHTMPEWARITGICYGTLKTRIRKGWSPERALTTPVNLEFSCHRKQQ